MVCLYFSLSSYGSWEDKEKTAEGSLLISTIGSVPLDIKPSAHMLTNIDPSIASKPKLEQFWNLESIEITGSPLTSDDD